MIKKTRLRLGRRVSVQVMIDLSLSQNETYLKWMVKGFQDSN